MNNDLKIIKKKYGEKLMHLCRELFSTILDNSPGILPQLLLDNLYPSHDLYDDIVQNENWDDDYLQSFKDYIYYLYDKIFDTKPEISKDIPDPVTLMHEAGYTLYECLTEEDIQKFKKYYAPREALCTFNGGRLDQCYVYFAVKKGAEKLNRQDFLHPERQDEYGTSVISIQFTIDSSHTLSIKNRYNHTVVNPDATFSNDLDNIIPGLTESFAKYYGMKQKHANKFFIIPNYVRANDGKLYRYNYEINNVYYCSDNIIIYHFQVVKYPKEKYLIFDYFILDLVNKNISCPIVDSFPKTIGKIKKINITNNHDNKKIIIINENNQEIIIELNKHQQITSYQNNYCESVSDNFLLKNSQIESLTMNNVKHIGESFLCNGTKLTQISLNSVETIGNSFLMKNTSLRKISFPKLKQIAHGFISWGNIEKVDLPEVTKIGSYFFRFNYYLTKINLPKVKNIGNYFMSERNNLCNVSLPEVVRIGSDFCTSNDLIYEINMPKVKTIGNNFLSNNYYLSIIDLPSVKTIGRDFMCNNKYATYVNLPNVKKIGEQFMTCNSMVEKFNAPNLENSDNLSYHLRKLKNSNQPKKLTK